MKHAKRFQIGSDVHGDMQDAEANRVFFAFAKIWKPEIRIMAGDLFDFRPLRRGACDDEKRETLRGDINAGKKWFNQFKPNYFLRGNHDERIYDLRENGQGIAADYAAEGCSEIEAMVAHHKCKMLPYHKRFGILKLGNLKVLHGFHSGINAVRQTALVYGACLMGHVHTIDEHSIPGIERRVARSIGALCALDMPYNNRQPQSLRHAHGFAYGVLHASGAYSVWQAECIGGKWMMPSDFCEL